MPHTHNDARPFVRVTLLAMAALCVGCGPGAPDWVEEAGYRWAELRVSGEDEPGFERLDPSETGISFENVVTEEQYIENSHYLNGSGVAAGDVDGDGRVDLYFAGMDGPNRLYRNLAAGASRRSPRRPGSRRRTASRRGWRSRMWTATETSTCSSTRSGDRTRFT